MTILKRLKSNKAPGNDSVVNEFLNMVAMRLLKIMIFEEVKYIATLGRP